jgi:putative Mn2+ efflux pump MntP
MTYFLILTALTVSIDSFVCGFSLSFLSKKKFPIVIGIAITVFLMCLITNYSGLLLTGVLTEKTAGLCGLILILIGIFNLIKKDDDIKTHSTIAQAFMSGFAVGVDGSLANLSLSLMGINAFYVPLVIALFHALLVGLGIFLSGKLKRLKIDKLKPLPPLVLIGLGAYKIISIFI